MDAKLTIGTIERLIDEMRDMDPNERIHHYVTINYLLNELTDYVENYSEYSSDSNVQGHFHLYAGELLIPLQSIAGLIKYRSDLTCFASLCTSIDKLKSNLCFKLTC
jgi:hypothetical protein